MSNENEAEEQEEQEEQPLDAEQLAAIDRLVARTETVKIRGETLKLHAPAVNRAKSIRSDVFARSGKKSEEATMALRAAAMAVAACLPGLTERAAEGLVIATGGEWGVLSRKALGLCGLSRFVEDAFEGGAADPTS